MGSLLSSVEADVFIESLEAVACSINQNVEFRHLAYLHIEINIFVRYVVSQIFLEYLNNKQDSIRCTMETESNSSVLHFS